MIGKHRKVDFSISSILGIILFSTIIFADQHGIVQGLQIKSISSSLMVGVQARFTCNYVKYPSEKIREVNWYAGYNGTSRKVYGFIYIKNKFEDFTLNIVFFFRNVLTTTYIIFFSDLSL